MLLYRRNILRQVCFLLFLLRCSFPLLVLFCSVALTLESVQSNRLAPFLSRLNGQHSKLAHTHHLSFIPSLLAFPVELQKDKGVLHEDTTPLQPAIEINGGLGAHFIHAYHLPVNPSLPDLPDRLDSVNALSSSGVPLDALKL